MPSAVAKVDDEIVAESDDTIKVEGNHYFPRSSVKMDSLQRTDLTTQCHWKGEANYYTVNAAGKELKNAAWTYEAPITDRAEPIKDYIAFYSNVVSVEDK